ncbi:CHASE2 and HATPase_c domain-containing protein [Burkholderia sp. FERM BP-3421]|jgi:signal transduction histidine kinase/CHASE2 domain-containing sensor protein|uniref:CHASE2 and HATPase_c domain-containing protein n=1 Tax=Burkholderia sp. FERM BP-3421 TaxID=1494466 RepID=UPI0023608438|nr:CHASE2 and HATPase_c domain-containing protein [Burkholderia sp. FERM BP-3421]WDD92727.1 CHASE2 and HATPase_c domain-containing protein [Burkholderia sp. FERM BP-3421]
MLPRWFDRIARRVSGGRPSGWLLALVLLALTALGYTPSVETLFAPLDRVHWDLVSRHDNAAHRGKVAVVVVDARTIAALGASASYARATHARLLERLDGAASVALDFTLVSPNPQDAVLARAIARHGRVVLTEQSNAVAGRTDVVLPPAAPLARAAAAIGQRNLMLGADHAVQGIVPFLKVDASGTEEPHVALQMLRVAGLPLPLGDVRHYAQDHVTTMGHIVHDALALSLPRQFDLQQYSYVDVLDGRVPASAFAGRVVFVGDTATDLSGGPYVLSAAGRPLSRVQVDALATDALLGGHLIRRVPYALQVLIGLAVALGMIVICTRASGARLYGLALGWVALFVASAMAVPLGCGYWMPAGPTVVMCGVIYAIYGWRRASATHSFLRREFDALRAGGGRHLANLAPAATSEAASPAPIDGITELMQQIRASRTAYVDLIRALPYPVFVEQGAQLVLSNEQGQEMLARLSRLAGADGDRAMLALARDEIRAAKAARAIRTVELEIDGRIHMMMVTPFGDGGDHGDAGSMICFVDVHDIRAAAESDRLTLRSMAHDLRNPLATMLALLEERSARGAGASADADFLGDLHRLVDYSLRVAQDFTQLARAEHLDARSYLPVSLNDLAAEAVDQVWHSATAKRIEVGGPHDEGEELFVLGHRDMLLRALVNLLDNAIKYSSEGTEIDVRIRRQGDEVALGIEDHGFGIPAAALPRLFEPFFQVDGARADASQGVGLGLPFVQTVITRHGGRVEVESVLGEGSRFTVRLARTEAARLEE